MTMLRRRSNYQRDHFVISRSSVDSNVTIDSIERVYIFPRSWSLSPYHQVHRCFRISNLSTSSLCNDQNEKFTFLCCFYIIFFGIERKPLIKTFLVCGILLVGWARAFHLLTFSNRLLLEICFTDVFCLFRSLRLGSILRRRISFSLRF